MIATETRGYDFLIWLQQQVRVRDDDRHGGTARKILAEVRRGARNSLHSSYDFARVAPHIGPYLSDKMTDADEWLSVIGALYAAAYANVPQINGVSLGKSLRLLRDSDKGNDSLEARFMALLNSREENLPGHLRQLIGLLDSAQKGIGLDWFQLLDNVQAWNRSQREIQKRWLRDFYRADRRDDALTSTDNTTSEPEGDNEDEN